MSLFLNPIFIISILLAISVHESAHGWMAHRLGDPTAKYSGRITLNPLAHLDLIGTLMFLIVGFGWAKPVPVDPRYFKHYKRDSALTAIAGPISNLILAAIAFIGLLVVSPEVSGSSVFSVLRSGSDVSVVHMFFSQLFASSLFINLALMAFNLLPVAPLDGSKVLHLFISYRYERDYQQYMRYGPMILLSIILLESFVHIPILSGWVFGIANAVLSVFSVIAGVFV
jgi:Zn-dependent protease